MPIPGVPAVRHHREEDWLQACVKTPTECACIRISLPMPEDKQSWLASVSFSARIHRRSASPERHVILGALLIVYTSE